MSDKSEFSSSTSVSIWLKQIQQGDSVAKQRLWRRYVERLIRLAKHKLGQISRRVADEDDVVQSAFNDFFRGVEAGQFERLDDRDDLWQVLVMLTERKAIKLRRHMKAAKRDEGRSRGESAFDLPDGMSVNSAGIGQLPGCEPTPVFAAQVREEFAVRFDSLASDTLKSLALGKMAGYTNKELADQLQLSLRAVERKLALIRRQWSEECET